MSRVVVVRGWGAARSIHPSPTNNSLLVRVVGHIVVVFFTTRDDREGAATANGKKLQLIVAHVRAAAVPPLPVPPPLFVRLDDALPLMERVFADERTLF